MEYSKSGYLRFDSSIRKIWEMMTLEEITQTPTPDMYFWYSLSIILAGALVWVVNRYVNRTDAMFAQLINMVNELRVLIKVHESEIKNHESDIQSLKDKVFGVKKR